MEMISIKDLPSVKYEQLPVITTELLAQLYGTTAHSIIKNHRNNAGRFIAGKHYYKIIGEELATLRVTFGDLQISPKTRSLILWTERGAARHAKMLETDQAWEVFEKLEDSYFCKKSEMTCTSQNDDIIQGDGHSFLIHFDDHNQISFTEKVPADAVVATMEKVNWWAAKNGYMMISKDEIKDMTLAQLLALK